MMFHSFLLVLFDLIIKMIEDILIMCYAFHHCSTIIVKICFVNPCNSVPHSIIQMILGKSYLSTIYHTFIHTRFSFDYLIER